MSDQENRNPQPTDAQKAISYKEDEVRKKGENTASNVRAKLRCRPTKTMISRFGLESQTAAQVHERSQ